MPLEFFDITKNKEGLYFKFYNNMFKKCLRYKIEYEVEKGTLTRLLKENNYLYCENNENNYNLSEIELNNKNKKIFEKMNNFYGKINKLINKIK